MTRAESEQPAVMQAQGASSWVEGSLTPRPGVAPTLSMLRAQTRTELTLLLRNGEQVLLSLVLPTGLLIILSILTFVEVPVDGVSRVNFFTPGVIALAVMSTAFTGQAIATGFERQYGVLKRLGATPLPRSVLLGAKTMSVLMVELLQLLLLGAVAYSLGWQPAGTVPVVLLVLAVGTATFSGLGLLLGGTLRGLTCLAVANLLWLLLFVLGGVISSVSAFGPAEAVLRFLPTAALSDGLRATLVDAAFPGSELLILGVWAVLGLGAAARLFRWE